MPPLITTIYTADPSAHVFNNRIYIYPSHDRPTSIPFNDNGDQYDMVDYHVFSLPVPSPGSTPSASSVVDHGVALTVEDVPWVDRQMWAPDVAEKNGKYYMYFPARDGDGRFKIGVAVGEKPEGPFVPDEKPIEGSYSIDPASFVDDDGQAYLFFGGLWGGQLQCYQTGTFDASWLGPKERSDAAVPAQGPHVAPLSPSMHSFSSPPIELTILDPSTHKPIPSTDHSRRYFEGPWVHTHTFTTSTGETQKRYCFSYSTGDTHFLAYAVSDRVLGPYVYAGKILEPVLGWTTHHSIVEVEGRTWLFYHDCEMSGGESHLRNVKVKEIFYDEEGYIKTTTPD